LSKTGEQLRNKPAVFPNKVTLLGNTAHDLAKDVSVLCNYATGFTITVLNLGNIALDDPD
jgi:hypothetical protein